MRRRPFKKARDKEEEAALNRKRKLTNDIKELEGIRIKLEKEV